MEQPRGFVAQGEIGRICRLRKSFYGNRVHEHGLVNSVN